MERFADRTKGKKIICFGAYVMPIGMCNTYRDLQLEERIIYMVDNDAHKQGQYFDLCGYPKKILSPDELAQKADADTVILITSGYYAVIIEQLEQYTTLTNTECYVYPLMKSLYSSYEKVTVRHAKDALIPKRIHYFWIGGNKKPDIVKYCIDSWYKYCPDYEIKEWNEDNYDIQKNPFIWEAYQAKKWAFFTDFARLDVVYTEGGIYLDTDVEIIRPIDDLLYNEAYFGIGNYGRVATGLGFGSIKGNDLIKYLMRAYEETSFRNASGICDLTTNTIRETPIFEKLGFRQEDRFQMVRGAAIFPSDVFCPNVPGTDIVNITENTFSIHHNYFSWASDEEKKQYMESIRSTQNVIERMITV